MMLPISTDFNHAYTYKIARFCHTEGLTFEDCWAWYKKKDDSYEKLNKWKNYHWPGLDNFPPVHIKHVYSILKNIIPH
jgi:hypothetical protein